MATPHKKTPEAIVKLKQAAALDSSIEEMAYYVGVSRQTIHNWLRDDEELFDEIARLRAKPLLKARQTIFNSLNDPRYAFPYLERKAREEWGPQTKVEHSGSVNTEVNPEQISTAATEAIREEYERKLYETMIRGSGNDETQIVIDLPEPVSEENISPPGVYLNV